MQVGEDDEADPSAMVEDEKVDELPSLMVSDVVPVDLLTERLTKIVVRLDGARAHAPEQAMDSTAVLFKEHPGNCPMQMEVFTNDSVLVRMSLSDRWQVHPSRDLIGGLKGIWGEQAVVTPNPHIALATGH